jgi:hypothetical protein
MSIATKTGLPILLLSLVFLATACSEHDDASTMNDPAPKEHFAKQKLDTIKKAEAVNQLVQDAAARQNRNIDEQSQ